MYLICIWLTIIKNILARIEQSSTQTCTAVLTIWLFQCRGFDCRKRNFMDEEEEELDCVNDVKARDVIVSDIKPSLFQRKSQTSSFIQPDKTLKLFSTWLRYFINSILSLLMNTRWLLLMICCLMDFTGKDLREVRHLSAFYIWCQKIKDPPLQNPSLKDFRYYWHFVCSS